MGELYNPFPRLPKNIRQIGDRDEVVKLYMEDYVSTYLKRLSPAGGQDLRVGLLLGTAETYEGVPYLFVDGAMEMEDVAISGETVIFSEAAWKKAYQKMEETFPKRTVQGWFICGAPGCMLSPLNYWKQHSQYFGSKNQVMYLNSGADGEEALYITSEDGFYRLKGYSIYYERNQMMQDYMILRKDARRVETGAGDRVIRDFRSRMEGRRQEAAARNSTVRMLGTLCGILSVAVLAGGVVMVGNYQKMKEMESVLVSVLPSGVKAIAGERETASEVMVEEIRGQVKPLPESQENSWQEDEVEVEPEMPGSETAVSDAEATVLDEEKEGQDTETASPGIEEEPSKAETTVPVTNMKPGDTYTIGEGETLYGICFQLYGSLDYLEDILALNSMDNADRIIAGQSLVLPDISGAEKR
ncbi:MAG: LysM peptidoglycan-binding domain-containing protein [Clostridium sp.]|jgi:hypothetical protein